MTTTSRRPSSEALLKTLVNIVMDHGFFRGASAGRANKQPDMRTTYRRRFLTLLKARRNNAVAARPLKAPNLFMKPYETVTAKVL